MANASKVFCFTVLSKLTGAIRTGGADKVDMVVVYDALDKVFTDKDFEHDVFEVLFTDYCIMVATRAAQRNKP